MAETLGNDPAYAAELLNSILADGDEGELRLALRDVIAGHGRSSSGGTDARDSKVELPTFPGDGPVRLAELVAALRPLGLRLAIEATGGAGPGSRK